MGCVLSRADPAIGYDDDVSRTTLIDRELKQDKLRLEREVKLLLLGAGESGKSCVLKQMRLAHGVGFSREERIATLEVIRQNVVQAMQAVLEYMDTTDIAFASPSSTAHSHVVTDHPRTASDQEEAAVQETLDAIADLWSDAHVRDVALNRSAEYQLSDSATFFFDSIHRFSQPDYLPTDDDILRARVRTTGITESHFDLGTMSLRLMDVGEQRSERRKWVHCFEDVTAIIFCIALSEYDQMLREDEETNRMTEALMLFASIVASKWFAHSAFLVFLNKIDIFKRKVLVSPVATYFPDYELVKSTETEEWKRAAEFFRQKVLALDVQGRDLYTHFTCAIDSRLMKRVIASVNDTVMRRNLQCVKRLCTLARLIGYSDTGML